MFDVGYSALRPGLEEIFTLPRSCVVAAFTLYGATKIVASGTARYLKEVDASETTIRFWQEIYDDQGKLVETHEKHPVDKGHRKA
jgi:hypothetical protein